MRPPANETGAGATNEPPEEDWRRYGEARRFMNETIVSALGLKSFLFVLKIEKTSTRADLRELFGDYSSAMMKALGESAAEVFISRMRTLLD